MDEALKAAVEAVLLAAALLDTRAAMCHSEAFGDDEALFWVDEANKLRDTATRLLPPADEWPKAKGDMGQLYDFKSRQRVN